MLQGDRCRWGHDSQTIEAILDADNTASNVWADSVYRSAEIEKMLKDKGLTSRDMGGTLVRSIGIVRAKARIGLKNLAYNMRRYVQLEGLAVAPP